MEVDLYIKSIIIYPGMALEVILKVSEKYKGLRRFAVPNNDTDPAAVDTTPRLLLGLDSLPPGFDLSKYNPERIARPAEAQVALDDLTTSSNSRAPYGIKVKISIRDQYLLLTEESPSRPSAVMDVGSLGRLNEDLKWQVPAYVYDEGARHRCDIIVGEIAPAKEVGPSAAVKFVKEHYSKQLTPKPLKP